MLYLGYRGVLLRVVVWYDMVFCDILLCVVLWCGVVCCGVVCHVVVCGAVLLCIVLCCDVLRYVDVFVWWCAVLHYEVMWRYMSCCAVS